MIEEKRRKRRYNAMTQAFKQQAQQKATSDVQNAYPNVYRADADLRNHAFAVAQQEIQPQQQQTSGDTFEVQDYAEAYIAAYRHAVEERDAQQ
jgi:chlorite dismutase